ncbi:hypothetical protein GCM10011409_38290 [Lentibacillus populi]|uniref:Uncharacterized protein n=1 Tax=Lentibacillus populi TaxID=1827502 RepID=A0A9W5U0S3_9BACI|nr:hypothetical protein [Virgibacillus dakarensis]GGB57103.1 hypothetical protein GCM10011409_38290 [Lentibacillus populi]
MELNKQPSKRSIFSLQARCIIGFSLCIILTAFSLWAAMFSGYSFKAIYAVLSVLAFIEAIIQLFRVPTSEQ